MTRPVSLMAICAAALLVAGTARAQLAPADAEFLKDAAQNVHTEIEGSKLALDKAVNVQVKGFAQQMVDDHTRAGEELAALAAAKGVEVPSGPSLIQKGKIKLLSATDGASFDRRYASSMGVSAHEDNIKLFQKAANNATDPDVKAFAEKTLPTLQHHLQMAQDLNDVAKKEGNIKTANDTKP